MNWRTLAMTSSYKLYAEFSEDKDGELARESVQTWICDNRLEVSNCIRQALENRKEPFCNWFRASEQHTSPDKLLLYCIGKQHNRHVSIFNSKYVWSTLANHIKYDYFEVVKNSDINLVFIGPRHYAIFRRKKVQETETDPAVHGNKGKGRGKSTACSKKKKTVCRSTKKKSQSTPTVTPVKKDPNVRICKERTLWCWEECQLLWRIGPQQVRTW